MKQATKQVSSNDLKPRGEFGLVEEGKGGGQCGERERELLWKEWEDKRDDCLHGHEQNVVVSFCF